jgi:hypothetical protein
MKIISFAPHSAIWTHAFPEALVVEALQQEGHEVLYVSCGGQFSGYCIPMSSVRLTMDSSTSEKAKVCKSCKMNRTIVRREFGFNGVDISDLISDEDRNDVAELLRGLNRRNFLDFEIEAIPVGRYALYEFLINHKKNSLVLNEDEWRRFQPELTNALFSFFASKKLLDREKPDRVLVYNSYYSVNHIFCELAGQRGIPHYFLHAGNNLSNRMQTLFLIRGYAIANWNRNPHWKSYRDKPCTEKMLSSVTDHMLALFDGLDAFAYSAPMSGSESNLKKRFGVEQGQKILRATLSSSDERVAAEAIGVQFPDVNCIYPTQLEWVSALIGHVSQRPEYCLIIRVHPRNFPNKRESIKSVQAEGLEKLLRNLPANIKVNWPAEHISIYDLAEITDVVLNGWSNAGKEMSLLGLPVVLYSHELVTAYPADINYVGQTQEEYFAKIDQAAADGWSIENVRKAYRWCAFEYFRSLINISESYPQRKQHGLNIFERAIRRITHVVKPNHVQLEDCRRRAPTLHARALINKIVISGSNSLFDQVNEEELEHVPLELETHFLKMQLRRLANALYGAELQVPIGGLGERIKEAL